MELPRTQGPAGPITQKTRSNVGGIKLVSREIRLKMRNRPAPERVPVIGRVKFPRKKEKPDLGQRWRGGCSNEREKVQ